MKYQVRANLSVNVQYRMKSKELLKYIFAASSEPIQLHLLSDNNSLFLTYNLP